MARRNKGDVMAQQQSAERVERREETVTEQDIDRRSAEEIAEMGDAILEAADTVIDEIDGVLDDQDAASAEMRAFLDGIDEVLVTNPEQFVSSFIQKGGQ